MMFLLFWVTYGFSFDAFIGNYSVASRPQVSGENTTHCDWMGFSEVRGVRVSLGAIEILRKYGSSRISNETLEYQDQWVPDTGQVVRVGSGEGWAGGTSASTYLDWATHNTWAIFREQATYRLELAQGYYKGGTLRSACRYEVKLRRRSYR